MGELPDWYPVLKAAKYLGVPPWELLDQPVFWLEVALGAQGAEAAAQSSKKPAKAPATKKG